ncbi:hypothetical protein KCP75_17440 [Salmonella enterica subsp. enterica]|nr:hypothetical protein KCP75_17440 [Salmonella enterica subsp. enterica]
MRYKRHKKTVAVGNGGGGRRAETHCVRSFHGQRRFIVAGEIDVSISTLPSICVTRSFSTSRPYCDIDAS